MYFGPSKGALKYFREVANVPVDLSDPWVNPAEVRVHAAGKCTRGCAH